MALKKWAIRGVTTALALGLGLAWVILAQGGSSQSATPADVATLSDSVKTQVTSGASQPPTGGATERGRVREGVEYIIRDASGKIKEQKSIGGQ